MGYCNFALMCLCGLLLAAVGLGVLWLSFQLLAMRLLFLMQLINRMLFEPLVRQLFRLLMDSTLMPWCNSPLCPAWCSCRLARLVMLFQFLGTAQLDDSRSQRLSSQRMVLFVMRSTSGLVSHQWLRRS
jgi:hypothetical protein